MAKLKGKPFNINTIQVYAPTTDHDDEEVEKFYDDIGNVMKYAKSGEINIVMGDWKKNPPMLYMVNTTIWS